MVHLEPNGEFDDKRTENQHDPNNFPLCGSIPPDTEHAVSVSLPRWQDNVDYEEGRERVVGLMKSGYPRFCVHESLNLKLVEKLGYKELSSYTFFSQTVQQDCLKYVNRQVSSLQDEDGELKEKLKRVQTTSYKIDVEEGISIELFLVVFPSVLEGYFKSFWQHTGEIISSRLAELCLCYLERQSQASLTSQKLASTDGIETGVEQTQTKFLELSVQGNSLPQDENIRTSMELAEQAKLSLRHRLISSQAVEVEAKDSDRVTCTFEDVYLYPTGMSAIYNAHQLLLKTKGNLKSVCFGFPYTDTLKVLQKFGPGCHFLGFGDEADLSRLELVVREEEILAVFLEFPSNPLLKSPDLIKIHQLSLRFGFAIVVDDTVATSINLDIEGYCDLRATSLTKIFSGHSNVMGGSLILSKSSPTYNQLKRSFARYYEDTLFYLDALVLERNSIDYVDRVYRINQTAEVLVDYLSTHAKIAKVYYPKLITNPNYRKFIRLNPQSGYGMLFSLTFRTESQAQQFYDNLNCAKGPSLGTNFTLACPYTLLAHYFELDWANQFEVVKSLIRVSVGLEVPNHLIQIFKEALDKVEDA